MLTKDLARDFFPPKQAPKQPFMKLLCLAGRRSARCLTGVRLGLWDTPTATVIPLLVYEDLQGVLVPKQLTQ